MMPVSVISDSLTINTIIAIFLLISGCNYGLHFHCWGVVLKVYWRDPEFRMFIGVQFSLVGYLYTRTVVSWHVYSSALMTINCAFFRGVDGDNRRVYD